MAFVIWEWKVPAFPVIPSGSLFRSPYFGIRPPRLTRNLSAYFQATHCHWGGDNANYQRLPDRRAGVLSANLLPTGVRLLSGQIRAACPSSDIGSKHVTSLANTISIDPVRLAVASTGSGLIVTATGRYRVCIRCSERVN